MQEKIDISQYPQINNFFLPQILSLQEQRHRLRCPNHNQATSVCISKECLIPGLMCLQSKCQCRRIHLKCHHILLDRVLESIEKHQKQIPLKVKQTYKTIYDMINQMIQKLSKLRTKFEKQEQYFGLRQEQLQFMDLIYQQKIEEVNGKIINSLEKTFDVDIQLNKNTKEQIIKDFESKRKEFDKICSYIEQNYLQINESNKKLKALTNKNLFADSKIIQNDQQKQMLNQWLKQSFSGKQIKSQLLFRASEHNFSKDQFHKLCDNKIDTIVIVKNDFDKKIGGFTSLAWDSSNINKLDKSDRSFMFSLNLKQKYKHVNKNNNSIYCHSGYGPLFGSTGSDLALYDKCNQNNNSFGNIGNTYNIKINNLDKYQFNTQQTQFLFTGNANGRNFKVKQYEVYQITQI